MPEPSSTADFEQLFLAYRQSVVGYFVRKGISPDQAHDLGQEVFLIAYQNLGKLRDPASFRAWLFGICHNVHLRQYRGSRRVVSLTSEEPGADPLERVLDPAPGALHDALDHERRSKLREALEALPQQMRACVKLSVVEELGYPEIAARLGLSVSSVKVHMHRARRSLAAKLGPLFERGEAAGE